MREGLKFPNFFSKMSKNKPDVKKPQPKAPIEMKEISKNLPNELISDNFCQDLDKLPPLDLSLPISHFKNSLFQPIRSSDFIDPFSEAQPIASSHFSNSNFQPIGSSHFENSKFQPIRSSHCANAPSQPIGCSNSKNFQPIGGEDFKKIGNVYNPLSYDPNMSSQHLSANVLNEYSLLRSSGSSNQRSIENEFELFPPSSYKSHRKNLFWTILIAIIVLLVVIALSLIFSYIYMKKSESVNVNSTKVLNFGRSPTASGFFGHEGSSEEDLDEECQEESDFVNFTTVNFPIKDLRERAEVELKNALFGTLNISLSNPKNQTDSDWLSSLLKVANESITTQSLNLAKEALKSLKTTEMRLTTLNFSVEPSSPAAFLQYSDPSNSKEREEVRKMFLIGFYMTQAAKELTLKLNLTPEEGSEGLILNNAIKIEGNEFCGDGNSIKRGDCNGTMEYRTLDGSCNNMHHGKWGVPKVEYRRILLPQYGDGISSLRQSSTGSPLPNSLLVSSLLFSGTQKNSHASGLLAYWAQLVNNDLDRTAQSIGENSTQIPCCENEKMLEIQHPECIPLSNSNENEKKCINLIRAAPAPICSFGPRQQFNLNTAFLDASCIYGSNSETISELRDKLSGKLKVSSTKSGNSLLLAATSKNDICNRENEMSKERYCFKSGDERVNENLGLSSLHLLLVRRHNNICDILENLNPHWDSSKIFEESRRIVIAELQQITYGEYLKILLGDEIVSKSGLELLQNNGSYYEEYDKRLNPGISNVYSAVGSIFYIPMLKSLSPLTTKPILLHKLFFNPFPLWHIGNLKSFISGLLRAPSASVGLPLSPQLTKYYLQLEGKKGYDLGGISIEKGRERGIGSYLKWREICGLTSVQNFSELSNIWKKDVDLVEVQKLYKSVEDLDLLVGALAEKHVSNGLIGPTFACLISDQFLRLRRGDRFWFESSLQPKPFSEAQLKKIKNFSLAELLCNTVENLEEVQTRAFEKPSSKNEIVSCSSFDGSSFEDWREDPKSHELKIDIGAEVKLENLSEGTEKNNDKIETVTHQEGAGEGSSEYFSSD